MMRTSTWIALALCTMALVASSPTHAQTRGPYLQRGAETEMTVVWRTLLSSTGRVCFGTDRSDLDREATGRSTTTHEVRLADLEPGTRYWYSVGDASCDGARAAADSYFDTHPPYGSDDPVRLWVVGDSGTGGRAQREVRDAMLDYVGDERPNLFLHVGDMAYNSGTTLEFDFNFYSVYETILRNTVVWPAMGNHEGYDSDANAETGPYYEGYVLPRAAESGGLASGTEAYYSFDYGNIHFIVLESYETNRSPDGAMLTWLREDLAATDQDWIIAYWHHPPYSKGSHDSDTEGQLIEMRENALPILEAGGVDLVLAGHSHIYERSWLVHGAYSTPTTAGGGVIRDRGDGRREGDGEYRKAGEGAVYIVAGHGGAGISRDGTHPLMAYVDEENGSVIIDIEGDTLRATNVRRDGSVSDSFWIVKEEGLFLSSPNGGDELVAGGTTDITWTSLGGTGRVHVDYTLDGGDTWYRLADATDDDGRLTWQTPAYRTTSALVRITDAGDASRTDTSDRFFSLTDEATTVVIPWGSVWEYSDDDTDEGTAWRTRSGGWPSGPAQLGYGDGDETTVLRDEDPNVPTVYFRHEFDLDGDVLSADLRALYDDAIVVWINGIEVDRRNVDDTSHDAYASSGSSDNTIEDFAVTRTAFAPGPNIVAAIVKQRSSSSSDLSFDLRLSVQQRIVVDDVLPDDPIVGEGGEDAGADAGSDPDASTNDASEDATGDDASTSDDVAPEDDAAPGEDASAEADADDDPDSRTDDAQTDDARTADTASPEPADDAAGEGSGDPPAQREDTGNASPAPATGTGSGGGCAHPGAVPAAPPLALLLLAALRLRARSGRE